MKRALLLGIVVGLWSSPSSAGPINLSFETGDFTGWTITNPVGPGEFDGPTPAGLFFIVDEMFPWPDTTQMPLDGSSLAYIGSGNAWFTVNRTWDVSASQALELEAGTSVSGMSFYFNGDYVAQDSVWVRILDGAGNILATPWIEYSGSSAGRNSVPYYTVSDWRAWEWTAPVGGTYILALGASTAGDNRFATFGGHDAIRVPEPGTLTLVGLSTVLLSALSLKRRG